MSSSLKVPMDGPTQEDVMSRLSEALLRRSVTRMVRDGFMMFFPACEYTFFLIHSHHSHFLFRIFLGIQYIDICPSVDVDSSQV